MTHAPVLVEAVLEGLAPGPAATVVDCTFGRGGHARAMLARMGPAGRVVAIDRDPDAIRAGFRLRDPRLKKKLRSAKEIKVNFLQLLVNCMCCSTFSELKLVTDNLLFSTTFAKLVSVRTNTRTVEGALCPRSWLPCCWRPSIPRQTLPSSRPLSGEGGEGR